MYGYHRKKRQQVTVISGKAKVVFKSALGKEFEYKNLKTLILLT